MIDKTFLHQIYNSIIIIIQTSIDPLVLDLLSHIDKFTKLRMRNNRYNSILLEEIRKHLRN